MKTMRHLLTALLLTLAAGCNDAQIASSNLSRAADNFEILRRVVFLNGITDTYLLSIEGLCSIEDQQNQLEVTCKVADTEYKKHFPGLSNNVSYFAEQLDEARVSAYHYRVVFKPQTIIPDIDFRGSRRELIENSSGEREPLKAETSRSARMRITASGRFKQRQQSRSGHAQITVTACLVTGPANRRSTHARDHPRFHTRLVRYCGSPLPAAREVTLRHGSRCPLWRGPSARAKITLGQSPSGGRSSTPPRGSPAPSFQNAQRRSEPSPPRLRISLSNEIHAAPRQSSSPSPSVQSSPASPA